jgi:hypothetical protein
MKTLIIVVHPNLIEPVINKKWLNELLELPRSESNIALGIRSYLAFWKTEYP